jgi:NAD+ synthase
MSLDDSLQIDPKKVNSTIVSFIRSTLEHRSIDGLVVLFKDCIECLITTKLAIKAVGMENVKLVVTRGRFSTYKRTRIQDMKLIDEYLQLPEESIVHTNLEEAIKAINNFSFEKTKLSYGLSNPGLMPLFNYNLSYFLLRGMASNEMEDKTFTPQKTKPSERDRFIYQSIAHYKSRIRLNMLLAFLVAETENKSFIGSTNKTEWLLGLFTKFGTHHAADLLPLANMYRTQTLQLGEYLGFEEYITSKEYKIPTSFSYLFNLSYKEVDRILIRLQSGMDPEKIHSEIGISLNSIKKVKYNFNAAEYARSVPLIPKND